MPLTDVQVRQARPREKVYKLRDERGLLLMVRPTGAKWWRLRYKFQGKENMLSLGGLPGRLFVHGPRPTGCRTSPHRRRH